MVNLFAPSLKSEKSCLPDQWLNFPDKSGVYLLFTVFICSKFKIFAEINRFSKKFINFMQKITIQEIMIYIHSTKKKVKKDTLKEVAKIEKNQEKL